MVYSASGGEVRRIVVQQGRRCVPVSRSWTSMWTPCARACGRPRPGWNWPARSSRSSSACGTSRCGSEVQYPRPRPTRTPEAQAQLAALREQLRSAQVLAPFDGVVDEMLPQCGRHGLADATRGPCGGPGQASVEVDLAEDLLSKVKVGDPVEVIVPELNGQFQATIVRVGQYINPNNRTFKATLRLDPSEHLTLRPNQLVNVRIRDLEAGGPGGPQPPGDGEQLRRELRVRARGAEPGRARKVFVKVLSNQGGELLLERSEQGIRAVKRSSTRAPHGGGPAGGEGPGEGLIAGINEQSKETDRVQRERKELPGQTLRAQLVGRGQPGHRDGARHPDALIGWNAYQSMPGRPFPRW